MHFSQIRNNQSSGSYSIENLLSHPPFTSSPQSFSSQEQNKNIRKYGNPNEFPFSNGNITPWNYSALNMSVMNRGNAVPHIFPFLQQNLFGTFQNMI